MHPPLFAIVAALGSYSPDVLTAKLVRSVKKISHFFTQDKDFTSAPISMSSITPVTINDVLNSN